MVSTLRSIPSTRPRADLCLFDSIESPHEEVRIRVTEYSDEVWQEHFLPSVGEVLISQPSEAGTTRQPSGAATDSNKAAPPGFQKHLEQTKEHAQRLEQILSSRKQTIRGPKCKGMEGVLAEGAEMIAEEADVELKDAGLIAVAQRVEHCEMARYGTARTYAELLGDHEGVTLLALTLEEERQTDQKLSELAKSTVNVAAVQ